MAKAAPGASDARRPATKPAPMSRDPWIVAKFNATALRMCFFGTRLGSSAWVMGIWAAAHAAVEKGQHDEMPRLDNAGDD